MISYSFYIPDGKEAHNITGVLKSPVKIAPESKKDIKPRFNPEKRSVKVTEHREKNTSFSIVYNK